MTDAEKMREAAAQWCADEADRCEDAAKWGGHRKYVQDCKAAAYALRNACSKIRSLPIDATTPAADCQQAALVTVDAAKYGRRNVQKMIRQWDAHRTACRAEGTQAIQDTLDAMEEHIDYAYRADTVPPGLLDEVKAALREIIKTDRIYGVTFGSGEREVWHDGDSGVIASAALARLEREVG